MLHITTTLETAMKGTGFCGGVSLKGKRNRELVCTHMVALAAGTVLPPTLAGITWGRGPKPVNRRWLPRLLRHRQRAGGGGKVKRAGRIVLLAGCVPCCAVLSCRLLLCCLLSSVPCPVPPLLAFLLCHCSFCLPLPVESSRRRDSVMQANC